MGISGNEDVKNIHDDKLELTDMTTDQSPQPERFSKPRMMRCLKRVTHKEYPRVRIVR
jgi:hypothetical protein